MYISYNNETYEGLMEEAKETGTTVAAIVNRLSIKHVKERKANIAAAQQLLKPREGWFNNVDPTDAEDAALELKAQF